MKKYIFIFLFITLFSVINTVSADSGACSYHGGVSCSAGPSINGNAICNDGFESSVSYYSMEMCKLDICDAGYAISELKAYTLAPLPEIRKNSRSNIELGIQTKQGYIDSIRTELNAILSKIEADYNSQYLSISQLQNNAVQVSTARAISLNPYSQSVGASTANNYVSAVNNNYSSLLSQLSNDRNARRQAVEAKANEYIQSAQLCINNLNTLKSGMDKADNYCINTYGSNAEPAGNLATCQCQNGYEFNENKTSCVKSIVCPANSTRQGQSCVANIGYVYKNGQYVSNTNDCRSIYGEHVKGAPGTVTGTSACNCETGYQWNANKTACNLIPVKPKPIVKQTPAIEKNEPVVLTSSAAIEDNDVLEATSTSSDSFMATSTIENQLPKSTVASSSGAMEQPRVSIFSRLFSAIRNIGRLFK